MPVEMVGTDMGDDDTFVRIPTETEDDDLVVIVVSNLSAPVVDARFVEAFYETGQGGIYYGISDGDLSGIPVTFASDPAGLNSGWVTMTIRGVTDMSDPVETFEVDDLTGGVPFECGVPAGGWKAAVAAFLVHSRGVPGDLGFDTSTGWGLDLAQLVTPFDANEITLWTSEDPSGLIPPLMVESFSSVTDYRAVIVLGLNGAPLVVRQYPRDDALGLGSSSRLYPPPKRNRKAGGFS